MQINDNAPAIEVSNLIKRYGEFKAVDGLSLSIGRGEIFGMLGPNGAGKSTTLETVVGLKKRDGGDIKVLGLDPQKQASDIKPRIGVQLQAAQLFSKLTVAEILKFFASFYPNPLKVDEVIEKVELEDKRKSRIGTLSGGQLQRAAVAIAMISNGDIIFLDEPTTGLDPQSRQKLWEVIVDIKKMGKTVFLTTHFMDEAQKICDRVAIVDHGKVVAEGAPQKLIETYFQEMSLELAQPALKGEKRLAELSGVTGVSEADDIITIRTKDITRTIGGLLDLTKSLKILLEDFKIRQANLEDVFLKLTGRSIRE